MVGAAPGLLRERKNGSNADRITCASSLVKSISQACPPSASATVGPWSVILSPLKSDTYVITVFVAIECSYFCGSVVVSASPPYDGKNKAAVCREAEIERSTLYDLLNGKNWADAITMVKLEATLGIRAWPPAPPELPLETDEDTPTQ